MSTLPVPRLRSGSPDDSGLDSGRLRDAARLVEGGIRTGVFPGAVVLVARDGVVGWHQAFGEAQVTPIRRAMTPDTVFDLASLTKVLATLPAALALWERGLLDLDAPVRSVVSEFSGEDRDRVTFRHLLAHTSGLPAWRGLYLRATEPAGVLAEICRTPPAQAPGVAVEYSDLGILLLGFAMDRLSGRRTDAVFADTVAVPLGLTQTRYVPPKEAWPDCAATEAGNAYERNMTGDAGSGFAWREDVLCGEVHDGNAHYAMQGVAPHAGLFSTAWEVATMAHQWLRPGVLVSHAAVGEAVTDQRRGAAGYRRGLGWVLAHEGYFLGTLGPNAFGHTGFTGTSVAVDPDVDAVVVLLTSRVHPRVKERDEIAGFRIKFHEAVSMALKR